MAIIVVHKHKTANYIYCGRGSPLGNPFVMTLESDRDQVCDQYIPWFNEQVRKQQPEVMALLAKIEAEAYRSDINLGCFCAPKRCHCDTIKSYIEEQLRK